MDSNASSSSAGSDLLSSPDYTRSESDGYVVFQKPYGCGCGKCSLNDFLDGYCSAPDTAIPFPSLDTMGLAEVDRDNIKAKLFEEFHKISKEFSELNEAVCKSLINRAVPLHKVAVLLQDLRAFPAHVIPNAPLMGTQIDSITTDNTVHDVFDILWHHISFFNFQIIEHLVNHLGTDYDKVLLCKYKKNLDDYCSRNICECPSFSNPNRQQVSLVLKVEGLEQSTMHQLITFMTQLATALSIASHSLRMCAAEDRCKKFVFQVPLSVMDTVFPLRAECIRMLAKLGESMNKSVRITLLKCGFYLYQLPVINHNSVLTELFQEKEHIYSHGILTRTEAESLLSSVDYNCFLVRQSPNAAGCVIYSYKDFIVFNHVKQEGNIDLDFIHKTEGSACLMPVHLEENATEKESETEESTSLEIHSELRNLSNHETNLDNCHSSSPSDLQTAAANCSNSSAQMTLNSEIKKLTK